MSHGEAMVVMKQWWEQVLPYVLKIVPKPHAIDPSCDVALSEHSGSELVVHRIDTEHAISPSAAYVSFSSFETYGFGAGIPVYYMSMPPHYAFKGALNVCVSGWLCSSGQPRTCKVALEGRVDTSVEPDEMTYTYSLDLYCGGELTCNEYGTFKGTRKTGAADGLEGDFYGTQEWTVKCCSTRDLPWGTFKGTGKGGYKGPVTPGGGAEPRSGAGKRTRRPA